MIKSGIIELIWDANISIRVIEIILNANVLPMLSMVLLMVFVCKNPLFGRRQTILFVVSISAIMLAILAVSVDTLIDIADIKAEFYIIRRITSFLNFSLSPLTPFLLYKIFSNRKTNILLLLPLIINIVLCFISMFVKVVFFISDRNLYGRGDLFFFPFLVTIFYVGLLIVGGKKVHSRGKSTERVFLMGGVLILAGAMCMEIFFYFRNYIWGATALIFLMYYLLLSIQSRVIDQLTGLYNRAMYYNTLNSINKRKKCAIAMLDINDFKSVNDTLGHEAGDRVLKTFARLLDESMRSGSIAYRVGGDEFVCIGKDGSLDNLNSCLEKLEEKCSRNNISFAWGSVLYTPDKDVFEAVGAADALMYIDKETSKTVTEDNCAVI